MPGPNVIAFRLTSGEHARLAAAAAMAGLAPAGWCRRAVLEQLAAASLPAAAAPVAAGQVSAAAAPAGGALGAEPLSCTVAARLTPSQLFDLEARAKGAGVTVGTYLRHLVQGQPPASRPSAAKPSPGSARLPRTSPMAGSQRRSTPTSRPATCT